MQYEKPIYIIREDTCLASDDVIPYGDRIEASSESKRKKMALELLDFPKESGMEE